ncbi:PDZ domain-containing protein [Microbulbifer sp. CnH-101-G]|uniref:PDZ domain-containing protein n=1 Tax=Microbulbifer sp. CnH-101-G TaxID=3243393 RepID=UPI004039451F
MSLKIRFTLTFLGLISAVFLGVFIGQSTSSDTENYDDTLLMHEKRIREIGLAQKQLQTLLSRMTSGTEEQSQSYIEADFIDESMVVEDSQSLPSSNIPQENIGYRQRMIKRLVDSGFDNERAEEILLIREGLDYERRLIEYKLQHITELSSEKPRDLFKEMEKYHSPFLMMSERLSKDEFELYLKAHGLSSQLAIGEMAENSSAKSSGLNTGDKVISYNGSPVVTIFDLRNLIRSTPPGESIPVEIIRSNSNLKETIYVPSGPLGILNTESNMPIYP